MDEIVSGTQSCSLIALESSVYDFRQKLENFSSHDKVKLTVKGSLSNFHKLLELGKQAVAGGTDQHRIF